MSTKNSRGILLLFLAFFLAFTLTPESIHAYCLSDKVFEFNQTMNLGGNIAFVSSNFTCPNGCDIGRGICAQNYFGTPIELFIVLEIAALAMFIISIMMFQKLKGDAPVMIPLVTTVLFFLLALSSAAITQNGEFIYVPLLLWLNVGLAGLGIIITVVSFLSESFVPLDESKKENQNIQGA
jgi:hypothetical protein